MIESAQRTSAELGSTRWRTGLFLIEAVLILLGLGLAAFGYFDGFDGTLLWSGGVLLVLAVALGAVLRKADSGRS